MMRILRPIVETAISRDERWMALTATNAPHLVVYDTSANPPRCAIPLAAPEMSGAPTFSDHGRWLAYATDKSADRTA